MTTAPTGTAPGAPMPKKAIQALYAAMLALHADFVLLKQDEKSKERGEGGLLPKAAYDRVLDRGLDATNRIVEGLRHVQALGVDEMMETLQAHVDARMNGVRIERVPRTARDASERPPAA